MKPKTPNSAVGRKSFVLLGMLSLGAVVLLLFLTPPAKGYEISLYRAYPWYFWGLIALCMLIGQFTILRSALVEDGDDDSWAYGFVLLLVTNAVLLLMPYIRGYPVYGRADVLTHVGYVQNIAVDGVIGSMNVYPNFHILIQMLSFATGVEPRGLINLVPVVISFVYFGSMYLVAQHLFDDRTKVLFAVAFLSVPVSTHLNATPFSMSILLAPFCIYLFIKEQQTNTLATRTALVVALIAQVIYHPLTALFLIITFGVYHVVRQSHRFGRSHLGPTNVMSLVLVVFTAWYYNFAGMIRRFESVFGVLLATESGTSVYASYSETVARTSPALADLVRIAVFRYGLAALLVGLGALFLLVAYWLWRRDRYEMDLFTALFSVVFVVFSAGSVAFFVNDFIVGFGRPLAYSRLFNVVLAGALFYLLWQHLPIGWPQVGVRASLGVVLFLIVVLTIYGMYPSPMSTGINHQVTEMELEGSEWVFENRNQDLLIDEFGISQYRPYDALYGTYGIPNTIRNENTLPPEHFNYTVNEHYGESYDRDTYLLLTKLGRVTYQEKFPDYRQYWRYTPEDYDRIERDKTVTHVYDNGEFDAYLVNGINGTST